MNLLRHVYRDSLSLLADMHQLTTAHNFWRLGRADEEAVFYLTFESRPAERGNYIIAAGVGTLLEHLEALRFDEEDVEFLRSLKGNNGQALLDPRFVVLLGSSTFGCSIDAVPEGTVVFANEPVVRVRGPIVQCLLLEAVVLAIVGHQSAVATKACRICTAAQGQPVLEFRLQSSGGIDGALAASRAAHIGGCSATSNVLAGKMLGIPVRGSHGPHWVQSFEREAEAFNAFGQAMPNNCVLQIDMSNVDTGLEAAIVTGRQLREQGFEMVGVRIESRAVAEHGQHIRRTLDRAGLADVLLLADVDGDEEQVAALRQQDAGVSMWAVGDGFVATDRRIVGTPVYRLAAFRPRGEAWQTRALVWPGHRAVIPGIPQIRRYMDRDRFLGDVIHDERSSLPESLVGIDEDDHLQKWLAPDDAMSEDLLVPMMREGRAAYKTPVIGALRKRTFDQMAALPRGAKRLVHPWTYPVSIEATLFDLRLRLIQEARGATASSPEG